MDMTEAHCFRLIRSQPGQDAEILEDGPEAAVALWQGDATSLTAACLCGWTNPHPGPQFPRDLPKRFGREAPEPQHCRWYHQVAWAQHAAHAEGAPSLLEEFQDPKITTNDICRALIFGMRLLLDRVQEEPVRIRGIYTAVETVMRDERIRRSRMLRDAVAREPVGVADGAPEWARMPEDIAAGVQLLLERTGAAGSGYWDCMAIEMAAGELSRLAVEAETAIAA